MKRRYLLSYESFKRVSSQQGSGTRPVSTYINKIIEVTDDEFNTIMFSEHKDKRVTVTQLP